MGVRIEHVLETHNHADHVSGHGRLAAATGATIHVHRGPRPTTTTSPSTTAGSWRSAALPCARCTRPATGPSTPRSRSSTPGAGPSRGPCSPATRCSSANRAPRPRDGKEEGARGIFHSLHGRLLDAARQVEVWPGHLGGSLCGGPGMDMKVSSTIGYERAHNELLRQRDEDAFVSARSPRSARSRRTSAPSWRSTAARSAAAGRAAADAAPGRAAPARGALVVDVRTELQFDDAHIPGAICITVLRAGFGSRLAWLADHDRPVVFVGRDDDDAVRRDRAGGPVGVTNVGGYLAGGMTSWREEQRPVGAHPAHDGAELHDAGDGPALQVLDVRERSEWERGPHPRLRLRALPRHRRAPGRARPERPVAVDLRLGPAQRGRRSLLERHGAREVIHVVDGGVGTWKRHGWPLDGAP